MKVEKRKIRKGESSRVRRVGGREKERKRERRNGYKND